jgi:hypothetical protein
VLEKSQLKQRNVILAALAELTSSYIQASAKTGTDARLVQHD